MENHYNPTGRGWNGTKRKKDRQNSSGSFFPWMVENPVKYTYPIIGFKIFFMMCRPNLFTACARTQYTHELTSLDEDFPKRKLLKILIFPKNTRRMHGITASQLDHKHTCFFLSLYRPVEAIKEENCSASSFARKCWESGWNFHQI